jgi:hypothetical protein
MSSSRSPAPAPNGAAADAGGAAAGARDLDLRRCGRGPVGPVVEKKVALDGLWYNRFIPRIAFADLAYSIGRSWRGCVAARPGLIHRVIFAL